MRWRGRWTRSADIAALRSIGGKGDLEWFGWVFDQGFMPWEGPRSAPSSRLGRRQSIRSRRFASDTESGPIRTWPIATATMPASTTGIERDCSQMSIMQASGMR
jgi:hypothetical protein